MNEINLAKKYQPLFQDENWTYAIITGGRASAKSFSVSTFATLLLTSDKKHRVLFTRYTMVAADMSIIPEYREKIELLGLEKDFDITKRDIFHRGTGSDIIFRGIQTSSGNQTAKLKSIPGLTTWILDEAEELVDETIFDTIDYSIRQAGVQNRIIIVMNPALKEHFIYKRFFEEPNVDHDFNGILGNTLYIHTTYLDNLKNLSPKFIANANDLKVRSPLKYNHIFLGEWANECEGALWKMKTMIAPFRVLKAPAELRRVVVGVDPSVTSTGNQDECGIIVAGESFDGHYYILADSSGQMSTGSWARVTVAEYKNFECDNIIAEVNQGGDLVKMNIKNIDASVPVKMVRATRGKLTRAEPIATLYEEGLVHHVGGFSKLETEMTTFTGHGDSPNRLDALVWVLTELSQNNFTLGIRSL